MQCLLRIRYFLNFDTTALLLSDFLVRCMATSILPLSNEHSGSMGVHCGPISSVIPGSRDMYLGREFEEMCAQMYYRGKMFGEALPRRHSAHSAPARTARGPLRWLPPCCFCAFIPIDTMRPAFLFPAFLSQITSKPQDGARTSAVAALAFPPPQSTLQAQPLGQRCCNMLLASLCPDNQQTSESEARLRCVTDRDHISAVHDTLAAFWGLFLGCAGGVRAVDGSARAGFVHLYCGQEAVSTGVIRHLRQSDYICSTYRDHVHALSKGVPAKNIMAELYGKKTGICRGQGGSMHMFSAEHGLVIPL